MTASDRVEAFRCWVPSSNSPGLDHALTQWLDSMGLFAEVRDEPPLEPGDPSLLSLLLGPADGWTAQPLALDHLALGGAAVLDAEALTGPSVAERAGLKGLTSVNGGDGVVGRVRGDGLQPAAVWEPTLWSPNQGSPTTVAVLELKEKVETPGVFLAGSNSAPMVILAFPVARIAAWFLGAVGDQPDMGIAPIDASPYDPPHAACSSPFLDVYGELLWRALGLLSSARGRLILRKRPLPVAAGPVLCLSHDIDGLRRNARALANDAIRALGKGRVARALTSAALATSAGTAKLLARAGIVSRHQPDRTVPRAFVRLAHRMGVSSTYLVELARLLQAELDQGARSTLFFLDNKSWTNSDYSFQDSLFLDATSAAARSGCNLGLHGTFQSGGEGSILMSEAAELREAVSSAVVSVRQHHLLSSPAIRRSQQAAGFKVDSSLGHNYATAFRAGTARPFRLFDRQERRPLDLWEVPLIVMDSALAAEFDGVAATERELKRLVKELTASQGVLTLNWHPNFRGGAASSDGYLGVYKRFIQEVKAQSSGAFWTVEELFEWYQRRAAVRLKSAFSEDVQLGAVLSTNESDTCVEIEFAGALTDGFAGSPASSRRVVARLEPGDNTVQTELTKPTPSP